MDLGFFGNNENIGTLSNGGIALRYVSKDGIAYLQAYSGSTSSKWSGFSSNNFSIATPTTIIMKEIRETGQTSPKLSLKINGEEKINSISSSYFRYNICVLGAVSGGALIDSQYGVQPIIFYYCKIYRKGELLRYYVPRKRFKNWFTSNDRNGYTKNNSFRWGNP